MLSAYWIAALALVGLGLLAGFSIGQPFFLVGIAMIVLGPFRRRPLVFWPALLAVIAYDVAYFVAAPLGCRSSGTDGGGIHTVCSNLIGLSYEGDGLYDPSLMPAVIAGLLVAGTVLVMTFGIYGHVRRVDQPSSEV